MNLTTLAHSPALETPVMSKKPKRLTLERWCARLKKREQMESTLWKGPDYHVMYHFSDGGT
jgi:hypothetical protein